MIQNLQLNFPCYHFRMRACDGVEKIWDDIRKTWLVLTPEEWVRRHVVRWIVEEQRVNPQMIAQEYPVNVQGQPQRADVVIFDRAAKPLLLVECKEPNVEISNDVYAQAVRYNAVLNARYIMITNGVKHKVFEKDADGRYVSLSVLPDLV